MAEPAVRRGFVRRAAGARMHGGPDVPAGTSRARRAGLLLALLLPAAAGTVAPQLVVAGPPGARRIEPRREERLRSGGHDFREEQERTRRLRETLGIKPPSRPDPRQTFSPLVERKLFPSHRARPEFLQWVQESLNKVMDAGLSVDGLATPRTRSAIRRFQESRGLRADGVVGPKTEEALSLATGTSPPRSSVRSLAEAVSSRVNVAELVGRRNPMIEHRDPVLLNEALYVDVQRDDGETRVLAWVGALRNAPAARVDPTQPDTVRVSGAEQLIRLLDGRRALISAGEPLPRQWEDRLRRAGIERLRISQRSPKKTLGEHAAAAAALHRRFERGKTRVFSALPRANGEQELRREVETLGLPSDQAMAWRSLIDEIRSVEAESGYSLEVASKESVLEALRNGSGDTIVLFAHSQHGNIHLPGGELITPEELAEIRRDGAPDRLVVLFSCETGTVDAPAPSIAEALLDGRSANVVLAPERAVSARRVPHMLRRLLIDKATYDEAFRAIPGGIPEPPTGRRFDGKTSQASGVPS